MSDRSDICVHKKGASDDHMTLGFRSHHRHDIPRSDQGCHRSPLRQPDTLLKDENQINRLLSLLHRFRADRIRHDHDQLGERVSFVPGHECDGESLKASRAPQLFLPHEEYQPCGHFIAFPRPFFENTLQEYREVLSGDLLSHDPLPDRGTLHLSRIQWSQRMDQHQIHPLLLTACGIPEARDDHLSRILLEAQETGDIGLQGMIDPIHVHHFHHSPPSGAPAGFLNDPHRRTDFFHHALLCGVKHPADPLTHPYVIFLRRLHLLDVKILMMTQHAYLRQREDRQLHF